MWNQYCYYFDYRKLRLVGPVQQKIKLPSPYQVFKFLWYFYWTRNWTRNINYLLFCYLLLYLIRHQQKWFKHVKRASSKKVNSCGLELFNSSFSFQQKRTPQFQTKFLLLAAAVWLYSATGSVVLFVGVPYLRCRSSRSQMFFKIGVL